MADQRETKLIDSYRKLLANLLGQAGGGAGVTRARKWPEIMLPASREELGLALDNAYATVIAEGSLSDTKRLDAMKTLLDQFEDSWDAVADTVASAITTPGMLGLAYAVWLGFRGDGWSWLVGAILGAAGAYCGLLSRFSAAMGRSGMPGFVRAVLSSLCSLVFLFGSGALWIRLVFGGVLSGLYRSVLVEFSVLGIVMALIAALVALHYSKGLNTLFFLERAPLRRSEARPEAEPQVLAAA
jgi:hypothetical protein